MLNNPGGHDGRWLIVGQPDSRRVMAFKGAVERLQAGQVDVVPYVDLLSGTIPPPPRSGTMIRLESPGGDATLTRELLRAGIESMEAAGRRPVAGQTLDQLDFGRGELTHPRQWMMGYRTLLERLESAWSRAPVVWMSTPRSVVTAFDKLACLQRWESAQLPTPQRWDGIQTYHQLRETIQDRHARLFIKLRYGYSAMGAVALEWRGDLVRAITTVESIWSGGRPRLFLSKQPITLQREFEIARLIDTLAMEDLIVEEWLPKARYRGLPYDVRLVCLNGVAWHAVGRARSSPFTNLNLDATRIERPELMELLQEDWTAVEHLAGQAAQMLDGAFMVGLDVLIRPGGRRLALLEANAFGDYLPGLQYLGQSTYEAEIDTFLNRSPALQAGMVVEVAS